MCMPGRRTSGISIAPPSERPVTSFIAPCAPATAARPAADRDAGVASDFGDQAGTGVGTSLAKNANWDVL